MCMREMHRRRRGVRRIFVGFLSLFVDICEFRPIVNGKVIRVCFANKKMKFVDNQNRVRKRYQHTCSHV